MPQQQPIKLHSLKEAMNGVKKPSPVRVTIKWKPEEWNLIVKEYRSQRLRKGVGVEQAVKQCQHVLPTNRHRPVNGPLCSDINKRAIKAAEAEMAAAKAAEEAKAEDKVRLESITADPLATASLPQAAQPAAQPAAQAQAPKAAPVASDDLPRSPGEVIVHELTMAFASIIANALSNGVVKEAIKGVMRELVGGAPVVPDPMENKWADLLVADVVGKQRMPRILIGGIVGPNVHTLRERFGRQFDLRFWSFDKSTDELETMAAGADLTIGYTKYLSQGHEQIMKNKAREYLRCIGGLGILSDLIASLPARGVPLKVAA